MLPIILRKVVSNYLPSSRTMRECYVLHSFVNTGHCTLQWIPILIQGNSQSPCHGLQDPAWSLISLLLFVHDLISLWPHWAEAHSHITTLHSFTLPGMVFPSDIWFLLLPYFLQVFMQMSPSWWNFLGHSAYGLIFHPFSTARHLSPSHILLNSFIYLVYQLAGCSYQNVNSIRTRISFSFFFLYVLYFTESPMPKTVHIVSAIHFIEWINFIPVSQNW